MKFYSSIVILLIATIPLSAQDNAEFDSAYFLKKLEPALQGLLMTSSDLSLRDDYIEKDLYRFQLVDSLMHSPVEMLTVSRQAFTGDIIDYPKLTGYDLNDVGYFYDDINPEPVVKEYLSTKHLDKSTIYRLGYLLAITKKISHLDIYKKRYDPFVDSLVFGMSLLLEEDAEDEFKSIEELDQLGRYEEEWTKFLTDNLDRVVLDSMAMHAPYLTALLDNQLIIDEYYPELKRDYIEYETKWGKVCIGDSSEQHYEGDIFIVIDYGGNDTYDITRSKYGNFTYILDYGGDDLYRLPQNRFSVYTLGVNFIADFDGDDSYFGGSWSLGAGLIGIGILYDKTGNDKYFGDTFSMGAGCFGYGLLEDLEGDDLYRAALFSQGFGFIRGLGVLHDYAGNDSYFAGGKYKDFLRYEDHYLSLSQGFGYGLRPYMSGGVGMLIDNTGNDTYESDIFGQGCSYWWSLGILADSSGNDKYLSFQYAQGSATHMTLGCLLDIGGNDVYISKGVSQGCGHDRSTAILCDVSGEDNYMAHDLSQGAGSANGIGIITDFGGIDSYLVKNEHNTQGYGNPRREYGSIGIFLDIGGDFDSYAGGPGADSTWWLDSKWGIGIDK